VLFLSLLLAAAPSERVLVHHEFYPGFMGPRANRTTYTLTVTPDGGATLRIEAREADQRQRFNPTGFSDAGVVEVLEGTAKKLTFTFPATPARGQDLVLSCAPKTELVHVAGARVEPPSACSPCYDDGCKAKPTWTPPAVTERTGFSCRVRGETGLGERAFFSEAGDVEHVVGKTDCPPEGLRVVGPPRLDWSVFPEGTTTLRDVTATFSKKKELSRAVRTLVVTRKGKDVEAHDEKGAIPGLSCWSESLTLFPTDLAFDFGDDVCDGHDERPKKRGASVVKALRCLELTAEGWIEPTLVFVPGRAVERVDVNTGCTKQRAVRALPSLDAPTFIDR